MEPSDLALLPTLDALLQEGSVTKAARRVGLSTPAMSHALSRLRERLDDPLLVRAGRSMVLTPRAEALRDKVHQALLSATQALLPEREFSPRELVASYVVLASDYVLSTIGEELDRLVRKEAPQVTLRFIPNTPDDAAALREGADLAVGIYGELPPELRQKKLLTDRFVCVVREAHPTVKKRLSLDQFLELEHVQIAPRGKPGGYLDDVLAERGLSRRVARAVPYFLAALRLTAHTDYVLTVSERIAKLVAPSLRLRILEPPLSLRPYALQLIWHPRFDGDPGHKWLRDTLIKAAGIAAHEVHDAPRTRLEKQAPPRGKSRKRSGGPR